MHIVVLDGYTTNPGDLSWEPLARLGELTVYEDTPLDQVTARAKDADALLYNRVPITAELLQKLPRLRYLGTFSTGVNTTDLAAATRRGIPVCNIPSYCEDTVAQFTFSLLLALCNHVESHHSLLMQEGWHESVEAGIRKMPFIELAGKTLGLFGYGNIARRVAKIGTAFGMNVLAFRRSVETSGARRVSWEELLAESDVLSLHCPLTPETRHKIDSDALAHMKPGALLINTARGAIIDEAAVAQALHAGKLGGYAADVFETEPDLSGSPLCRAPRVICTPHIAWSSCEARQRLIAAAADNLSAWQKGSVQNQVNS